MASIVEKVHPVESTDSNNDQKSTTNINENNNNNNTTVKQRRRKRRWGDAKPPITVSTDMVSTGSGPIASSSSIAAFSAPLDSKAKALALKASIKARLAALKVKTASAGVKRPLPLSPPVTVAEGVSPNKRAKHYELDMSVTGPTFGKVTDVVSKPKPKLNPYLAHLSQEKDTVRPMAQQQQQRNIEEQPQHDFRTDTNDIDSENKYVDARLEAAGHEVGVGGGKKHRRRELKFVEPGTFVDIAQRKRERAANAESAGFVSGRKTGQYVKSTTMSSGYYGTTEILDDVEDRGVVAPRAEIGSATLDGKGGGNLRAMPMVVEWWDMELLPSKLKKQVAKYEGQALSRATKSQMEQLSSSLFSVKEEEKYNVKQVDEYTENKLMDGQGRPPTDEAEELRAKCAEQASFSCSKTAGLIQHIVPIIPPGEGNTKPVEPVLHLTKKERKKARKRRREQKQRELQDLQAVGLIEPPEPRLTLQNFIRVMGDQAYVDPSQMERTVQEQVQKRQLAHLERNATKKLTKDQRWEKRHNKILKDASPSENTTGAIHVALFYVKNASHPYHRTKIDLNAQQLNVTGGVVECDVPNVSCVICEGGPKAIQKYTRLMLVRMKWKGTDEGEDDDDEEEEEEDDLSAVCGEEGAAPKRKKKKFDKDNKCELVWTGMATKRHFKAFIFQHCETSDQAQKVLKSKGVGYYWDQVLAHASGRGDSLHLKLVDDDDDEDNDVIIDGNKEEFYDSKDVEMLDA